MRGARRMTVRGGVSYQTLLDEANAQVQLVSTNALAEQLGDEDLILIDLRDIRELQREGHLPDLGEVLEAGQVDVVTRPIVGLPGDDLGAALG